MLLCGQVASNAQISGFSTGNFTLNHDATGNPTIVGTTLTLTNNTANEAASSFYKTKQNILNFDCEFLYTPSGGGSYKADGFAFVLQNAPAGANALGGSGASLGYHPTGP